MLFSIISEGVVNLNPTQSGLPGTSQLQSLINGVAFWGLLAALAGLVIGAGTWALGAHSNNYQHSASGRRAVLISIAAVLIIGAAPSILNFFFKTGEGF